MIEVNNNFPTNWSLVKLGDVTEFVYGKGLIKSKRNTDGKFPVYGSNGVVGFHNEYLVEGPCLVIGRKGAAGEVHLSNKDCWPIDTTYYIKSSEKYSINYLYYILKKLRLASLDKSTAIPGLNRNDAYKLSIPLPPLQEQKKIVEKIEELFSGLDSGVASLKKAKEQISLYRQSVLASAFSGKFTQSTQRQAHSGSLTAEPKVEYSTQLTGGWKWISLKELSSVLGDGLHGTPRYSEDGSYYFINGNNLSDGRVEIKANTKRVTEEEYQKYKKPLNERTVFVSINGTIGNTAFFNGEKIILGKSACYFNLKENTDKRYIRYYLKTQRFINYANKTATGSTIKNVSLQAMRELEVPVPQTLQLQTQIVEEIEKRFSEADNLEKAIDESLTKSETLRQSILKQAFSGKLI